MSGKKSGPLTHGILSGNGIIKIPFFLIRFLMLLLFSHIIPTKVLDKYSILQTVIARFP